MRRLALAGLLAAACASMSQLHDDAASLAAAETAFAAHSVREDMRVAFLANFADDGVMVRGGWIVAKPYLEPRAAPPIVLDWHPAHVEVASSGEMGLSTGPWKLSPTGNVIGPPAYGQFCSMWRREGAGPWKVVVDIGIGNPQASFWDAPLELIDTPSGKPASGAGVEAAEKAFADLARASGAKAAYARYGAEHLRFYRDEMDPVVGREAALASPALVDAAWVVEHAESARSGDFAYTRGHVTAPGNPAMITGHFMRVWRPVDGKWRIVLDVVQPKA